MKFTRQHAKVIVEQKGIRFVMECYPHILRENNPELYQACRALIEYSEEEDENENKMYG